MTCVTIQYCQCWQLPDVLLSRAYFTNYGVECREPWEVDCSKSKPSVLVVCILRGAGTAVRDAWPEIVWNAHRFTSFSPPVEETSWDYLSESTEVRGRNQVPAKRERQPLKGNHSIDWECEFLLLSPVYVSSLLAIRLLPCNPTATPPGPLRVKLVARSGEVWLSGHRSHMLFPSDLQEKPSQGKQPFFWELFKNYISGLYTRHFVALMADMVPFANGWYFSDPH